MDGLTMLGDDLDAILDVLEENEFLQEEFSAAVNNVSAENLIFYPNLRPNRFKNVYELKATRRVTCVNMHVMYQSIPAVPIPPPGQPWGICSRCQSRGWGIRNFIAAPGAGH